MPRSSTPVRSSSVLALFLLALSLWVAPAHAQTPYTFEGLADTRGRFQDFGLPVINGNGDVAFAAQLRTGGSGIYKWSAATRTLVTIFEDPTNNIYDLSEGFRSPALTPSGVVIFQYGSQILAGASAASLGAIVDSATTRVPLADVPGTHLCLQPTLRGRSTDDNGRVVISCIVDGGPFLRGAGVYLAGIGTIERVCDQVSFGSGLPNRFTRCFFQGPLEVSAGGLVAGVGFDLTRPAQGEGLRFLLLRGTSAGLDVLLDPGLDTALAFPSTQSRLGINEIGTVAYDANQEAVVGSGNAIFTIETPGLPMSVTDPRNFVYRFAVWPSINNLGEVAFIDLLRNGLFNGPDPAFNKVIGITDTVPGYAIPGLITTVATVSFAHPGINTLGELTFVAHLGDGTLVITRALPPNNHPPDVIFGDQSTPEGVPIQVHVTASDQDGDYPLRYRLAPNAAPPPGTVVPTSPLPAIDSDGDITGVFGPGTAGQRYAFTLIVEDPRGRATSVDFIWTVTDPLPPPRQNLRAVANFDGQGIDLTWSNPSPDPVDRITVSYSTNGPGGPFFEFQIFPADTTSYSFVFPSGSGIGFCFTVNGVVIDGTSDVVSPNSNIACASYPRFELGLPQPPSAATDNVYFRVTANMPATLTLDPASIAALPPDALWRIEPVPGQEQQKIFDVNIWNLPVRSTPTDYLVVVVGESTPIGLDATHTVTFTTSAGAAPPPPGPGRVAGESAHRQGPIQVRFLGSRLVQNRMTAVTVELTNRGPDPLVSLRAIEGETSLVTQCIQTIEDCTSAEPSKVRPLDRVQEFPTPSLQPGASAQMTLWFADAFARSGGFSHNPTLQLTLTYTGAPRNLTFVLNASELPDLPVDLALTLLPGAVALDGTATIGLRIDNVGVASSTPVRIEIPVAVTRSAADLTPMPFAVQPLAWKKFVVVNRQTLEARQIDAGTCTPSGQVLSCTLVSIDPDLPRQGPATYITASLLVSVPDGGLLHASGSVSNRIAEVVSLNNTANADPLTVPAPQPIVDLKPTISFETPGQISGLWHVGARNGGPAAAANVVVELVLPPAVRMTSSGGLCSGSSGWGATITCRLPLIGAGSSAAADITIANQRFGDLDGASLSIVSWSGGTDIDLADNSAAIDFP